MKKKIAFIWYKGSTFIEQDCRILKKHFNVNVVRFDGATSIFNVVNVIRTTDIAFCWFADVWSFIAVVSAKLLKKKSVVVVGGYDVECVKEIGYGMCVQPLWRRWMRTYTLKHATKLLAVSDHTAQKAHSFVYKDAHKLKVVYNGVNTNYFKPKGEKENIVLTVVSGDANDLIALKGLDTFVKVAKYVPDATFIVVGLSEKDRHTLSKMYSSNNVRLLGKCTQADLLKWYQRAKVYCQLSKVESFGMALAEAMACGCVPIVMDVGALPEIVGKTGFVMLKDMPNDEHRVKQVNQEQRVRWIHTARDHNINMCLGRLARERIKQNFSVEKREVKLIEILEKI